MGRIVAYYIGRWPPRPAIPARRPAALLKSRDIIYTGYPRVYKVPLRGSEQLFAGGRPTCDAPDSRQRDSLLSRVGDQAAPVRRWRVTGVGSRQLMVRYGGRGGGD